LLALLIISSSFFASATSLGVNSDVKEKVVFQAKAITVFNQLKKQAEQVLVVIYLK
jgi:hypothetical protein